MFISRTDEKRLKMSKCRFILVRHGQSEANIGRMQAGQAVQTFEMADLKIINFGSYIEPSRFPVKITSWLGM